MCTRPVSYTHLDVYKRQDDIALVQTVDFFPPMVDDPYTFGQIAAANALSDVYAMGGEVKTALNLVCFPESMDLNILGEILRGGAKKVAEAGGSLAGGHSIADTGVKYGLSVTGLVNPKKMYTNDSGKQTRFSAVFTSPPMEMCIRDRDVAADMLLLDFVRAHGCKSVKRGCETSNCGLCTVFLDEKPVLSCSVDVYKRQCLICALLCR